MRRVDLTAGAAFAIDGMTAVAAAYNAAWLALLAGGPRPRRASAMALALLNVGIAAEAVFAQSLYSAHRFELSQDAFFAPQAWLPVRMAMLAGTLLISALILRRRDR